MSKRILVTLLVLGMILLLCFTPILSLQAVEQPIIPSIDSMVLSSDELEMLGFPPNYLFEKSEVNPAAFFSDDSVITKKAQSEVIQGTDFIYSYDYDKDITIGIRIVLFSTASWAKINKLKNWNAGNEDFENQPSYWYTQKKDNGSTTWFATTTKGRAQIAVFSQNKQVGSIFSEEQFNKLNLAIFNSQVRKIPILTDLPNHEKIDLSHQRIVSGLGFGIIVFLLPLFSALFSAFGDRGTRERFNLLYQRRRKKLFKPRAVVINLTRGNTSSLRDNLWILVRSLFLGAICIAVYFLTGSMKTLWMMVIIAVIIFVLTFIDLFIRMRDVDQGSEIFASTQSTFILGLFAIGSSTVIYCFGILIIFLGLTGILTFYTANFVFAALALFNLGIIVLTNIGRPIRFAERLLQPYKKQRIADDTRREVLLLRSFQDDDLEIRVHRESRHSLMEQITLQRLERFEELLAWNLWHIGPVKTVGQQGTVLEPLGAVRDYYGDDEWQPIVTSMMSQAQLIVFVVGRSRSLIWEVSQAKAIGRLGKCLFIIPPVDHIEASKRMQVLASALGITPDCFGLDDSGKIPCPIVAMYFNKKAEPVVITAPARDDITYQVATKFAARILHVTTLKPIYEPSLVYRSQFPINIEPLLTTFEKKPKRKRNSILHFVFDELLNHI